MVECSYSDEYLVGTEPITYKCHDPAQTGKNLCIFHDKQFLKNKNNHSKVEKAFHEKIRTLKNSRLECIGYYLPELTFKPDNYSNSMYFVKTTFVGKLDFSNNIFDGIVSFANSTFLKGAIFRSTTFAEKVYFNKAVCEKYADFQFCKFKSEANFSVRRFVNPNFKNTDFYKDAFFTSGVLKGKEISFWKSTFHKNAHFDLTSFLSPTNFKNSTFKSEANFEDAMFRKTIRFDNVNFINESQIIFNGNISQVSFLETKIEKIKFGNRISWKEFDQKQPWFNKIKLKIYKLIGHRNFEYKIFNERELEQEKESIILIESVRDIYRQLIENFDQKMRYDISGEFFVREMELRRNYQSKQRDNQAFTIKKSKFLRHFSILWAYNVLAQYGQSYRRPIYLIIPIILGSTFYFWYGDGSYFSQTTIFEWPWDSLSNSFARSLTGFFPFYDFNDKEPKSTVDFILRITLLPIAGTLFVALKRRLERKFRH